MLVFENKKQLGTITLGFVDKIGYILALLLYIYLNIVAFLPIIVKNLTFLNLLIWGKTYGPQNVGNMFCFFLLKPKVPNKWHFIFTKTDIVLCMNIPPLYNLFSRVPEIGGLFGEKYAYFRTTSDKYAWPKCASFYWMNLIRILFRRLLSKLKENAVSLHEEACL